MRWRMGILSLATLYHSVHPDPTLIGPSNHRQQASDGPSELSVPWFDNSPEVYLRNSNPNVCDRYNVSPKTARGLVIFVGSGSTIGWF